MRDWLAGVSRSARVPKERWNLFPFSRLLRSSERVEACTAPIKIGQGNVVRDVTDQLLQALSDAYREAAGGAVSPIK